MRRTALVAIAGLTLSGFGGIAAPSAMAATQKSIGLGSHINKVHTSSGKTLKLDVTAFKNTTKGNSDKATVGVTLTTGAPFSKGESHVWSFSVARGDFNYTASSGKGSVDASFGKYGSVNLAFNKTGQSTTKCKVSGSNTIVKGRLHGAIHFNTNTKAWGKVDNGSFSFDTPNTISVSNGCNDGEGGGKTPCYTGTSWTAPPIVGNGGSTFANGFAASAGGNTGSTIGASRDVTLSSPSGARRTDTLVAPEPAPGISGNTLTIKTRSSGPISGSAQISGGSTQNSSGYPCYSNGHQKTEHSKNHYGGAWSSPNGLRFNFKASSDVTTTKNGSASWGENTFN